MSSELSAGKSIVGNDSDKTACPEGTADQIGSPAPSGQDILGEVCSAAEVPGLHIFALVEGPGVPIERVKAEARIPARKGAHWFRVYLDGSNHISSITFMSGVERDLAVLDALIEESKVAEG